MDIEAKIEKCWAVLDYLYQQEQRLKEQGLKPTDIVFTLMQERIDQEIGLLECLAFLDWGNREYAKPKTICKN